MSQNQPKTSCSALSTEENESPLPKGGVKGRTESCAVLYHSNVGKQWELFLSLPHYIKLKKILLSTFNFPFSALVPFFILMSHSPLKQIQMKERKGKCAKNGNSHVLIQRKWQLYTIFFSCRWFLFMIMPLPTTT